MSTIILKCELKEEIEKEIEFFCKWYMNSKSQKAKERFYKHCVKLIKGKNIFKIQQNKQEV